MTRDTVAPHPARTRTRDSGLPARSLGHWCRPYSWPPFPEAQPEAASFENRRPLGLPVDQVRHERVSSAYGAGRPVSDLPVPLRRQRAPPALRRKPFPRRLHPQSTSCPHSKPFCGNSRFGSPPPTSTVQYSRACVVCRASCMRFLISNPPRPVSRWQRCVRKGPLPPDSYSVAWGALMLAMTGPCRNLGPTKGRTTQKPILQGESLRHRHSFVGHAGQLRHA